MYFLTKLYFIAIGGNSFQPFKQTVLYFMTRKQSLEQNRETALKEVKSFEWMDDATTAFLIQIFF